MTFKNKNARLFFPSTSLQDLSATTHLCIAAHQDDIEIMAAGAILECFGKNTFTGVVVTDGAGSPRAGHYAAFTDEDMRSARAVEQENAASIGQYNAQFQLGYTSSQAKDGNCQLLVNELADIIVATSPDIVFTHNFADKHDTHVAIAMRTLQALRQLPASSRPCAVYSMEVWRSLDWVCDAQKVLFDTSCNHELQKKLIAAHSSQISTAGEIANEADEISTNGKLTYNKRYDIAALGRKQSNATFFESSKTDQILSAEYGIDITALVSNDQLSPVDFITEYISMFEQDVRARIGRVSI